MLDNAVMDSPLGPLLLSANQEGITRIHFSDKETLGSTPDVCETTNPHLRKLIDELHHYFIGELTTFSVSLSPSGSEFQRTVWKALTTIPFGHTWSYGQLAQEIGNPKASRAVGGANNRNPIAIVIPCHRVIGQSNKLVGYAGELWRKQWLLEHEGIALPIG